VSTSMEDARLAHHAAEARLRVAAVPAPPQQPVPETHVAALATAHEGRPTVAEQQKRQVYP
jgi:hypothetical protein